MIITRATEYSIRAMLFLASKHPAPVVSKREICDAENITPAFLTKILQPLIKRKLVISKRGVSGGFSLARDPSTINLLDIMKAVDEPLTLNVCLNHESECDRTGFCPVHTIWGQVKDSMEEAFSKKSLSELAEERDNNLKMLEG